ncbi:uncharacterized protein [Leuresthes tenuis]|uniref:uncharacterized protein n=1 Tax=Leuresthes tenuis TaxID=355514 RepID=UPI003B513612
MYLHALVVSLSLGVLIRGAAESEWCYNKCDQGPSQWVYYPDFSCGGKTQSPIDINISHAVTDHGLNDFTFMNFSSKHVIKYIKNNGHTVKCNLTKDAVEVSGGGLKGTYSTLQFHFHWGDTKHHPGSEHMINGERYPMEMHIVSMKKGATVEEAKKDPDGFAVLGFFINATEGGEKSEPWEKLTSYLKSISEKDKELKFNEDISINDLIGHVDLTKFYRYSGSLTTPECNEAVVWTVFHEPINVSKDLIQRFASDTTLTNVYRPTQKLNGRKVHASPAIPLPNSHSWCYDDHCEHRPSKWHLLPDSKCNGNRQSPINIDSDSVEVDEKLVPFTFKNFGNKHAIKYITNTGHAAKCVLKDDLVEVSGGGLKNVYSTLQFHFHWGTDSQDSEGSEHTVDSKRYPMEMHIVNKRKDLSLDEALKAPDGLAVLGFFIEAPRSSKSGSSSSDAHETTNPSSNPTSNKEAWNKLTGYLSAIPNIGSSVEVKEEISIDDLLGSVNRDSYFRYSGSLTTPSCNEAVVWTVFKESVRVDIDMMRKFPKHAGYHDVFRPTQSLHSRKIYTSASSVPQPILCYVLLACLCAIFR